MFYHKSLHEKIQKIERTDTEQNTEHLLFDDESISRNVLRKEETYASQCSLLCKQATFTLTHGLKCDLKVPSISKGFVPVTINLPKHEIKIFDGGLNKWPMLHESFHCSLHPHPNISKAQKMVNLKIY